MKQRSPLAVFLLPFITFGIYSWYWAVKTKGEMNALGEKIPTAWIWLIPFVGSLWWMWKYSEGVEHVSKKEMSGVLAFVLMFLLGNIGQAIVQNEFNKLGEAAASPAPAQVAATGEPTASGPAPDNSFGGPANEATQPTAPPTDSAEPATTPEVSAAPSEPTATAAPGTPETPVADTTASADTASDTPAAEPPAQQPPQTV